MHLVWWIFWLIAITSLFSLTTPVSKGKARASETPLDILQRRFARGEIDSAQYAERKTQLTRDQAAA